LKPVTGKIKPEFARKKIRQAASSPTTVTGANILIIVKKPQSRRSIALRFGVTTGRYWPLYTYPHSDPYAHVETMQMFGEIDSLVPYGTDCSRPEDSVHSYGVFWIRGSAN
jgi:hypothetical protein